MSHVKIRKLVLAALFAALCTVMTLVIQIPSPMQGYVNLGDCAVLLSAWVLGPVYGGVAAGTGSMLADLFSGYAHYAPGTFLIKLCMAVAAALILADKTDVRRTRVRNRDKATFDIHDRVNYAVEKASTTLDAAGKAVVLDLQLDTGMSPVIDYFEIFLERMLLCRKAAEKLSLSFRLVVNGQTVL